jgi:hypothetical protein
MFVLSTELLTKIECNLLLWFFTKRSGGISFWFISVQHIPALQEDKVEACTLTQAQLIL